MVRALVIRLGEALAPVQARLEVEFEARRPDPRTPVRLETHDAPVAAVGNLSRPVQLLREQLEAALTESLNRLLTLEAGSGDDFVLDVYVIVNLGEPLVANATMVIIAMLTRIVDLHFRSIFPRHRTGSARRFRVLPIAILPAAAECEKDRSDAIDELRSLHESFVEERERPDNEFFVDRVFLLDSMTSRGIASRDELAGQVLGFLRLCILGGVRRHQDIVRLLEADRSDLFASFAIASCEVDYEAVVASLTAKMKAAVANTLVTEAAAHLPTPSECLPVHVLDDEAALERAIIELGALPQRTIEADGAGAVAPLMRFYGEQRDRVEAWRQTNVAVASTAAASTSAPPRGNGALGIGLVSGTILGAAVAATAHFYALVSATAVAASGGGVAVVVFLVIWLTLRRRAERQETSSARLGADDANSPERREAILDALQHTVEQQRTRLTALSECFDAIALVLADDDELEVRDEASPFRQPLVSPALMQALYERRVATSDLRGVVTTWLETVGDWAALLAGDVRPDAQGLDEFCAARFQGIGAEPLFGHVSARECVVGHLDRFVETWSAGLTVFLEGESRVQFDPDGFDFPFANTVFAPGPLHSEIEAQIARHGSMLKLHAAPIATDDVFVVSAVTDIHPDAVSPLADRRDRHES